MHNYLLDPKDPMLAIEFLMELYGGGAGVAAGLAVFTESKKYVYEYIYF